MEVGNVRKGGAAHSAHIGPNLEMDPLVHLQIAELVEALVAQVAGMPTLSEMIAADMIPEHGEYPERFPAVVAG